MPVKDFVISWNSVSGSEPRKAAEHVAHIFKVSRLAAAVRARNLSLLSDQMFKVLENEYTAVPIQQLNSNRRSGGDYYATLRRNAGAKYISLVLSEFHSDTITVKEAAALLDMRVPSLLSLAEIMEAST